MSFCLQGIKKQPKSCFFCIFYAASAAAHFELSLAKMTAKTGWQWQHQWQQQQQRRISHHFWTGPSSVHGVFTQRLALALAFFTSYSALSFSCFYCPANDVSLLCECACKCMCVCVCAVSLQICFLSFVFFHFFLMHDDGKLI